LLGRVDWMAVAIISFAAVALFRYQVGVIRVILGCAVAGLTVGWILK
jgi:chromate transporter